MQTGAILIGFAILLTSLPFLIHPFKRGQPTGFKNNSVLTSLADQRQDTLLALRDLDFDFRIGKVNGEDYPALRASLLAAVAQFIQRDQEADDEIEELIEARRAGRQQPSALHEKGAIPSGICPDCRHKILSSDVYCVSCGIKLESHVESA